MRWTPCSRLHPQQNILTQPPRQWRHGHEIERCLRQYHHAGGAVDVVDLPHVHPHSDRRTHGRRGLANEHGFQVSERGLARPIGSAESSLPAGRSCGTERRGYQYPDVVYRYQQLLGFPRRSGSRLQRTLSSRVACGGKDNAVSHTSGISLWRGGAPPYPTHRAQPVEGMGIALSHTSGTGPWRGWASYYPTHRALARGGDGDSSFHTPGRHCRSFSAEKQSPCFVLPR